MPFDAPGAMDLHSDLSFTRAQSAPQIVLANGYLGQGAEAAAWVLGSRLGLGFVPLLYRAPLFKQLGQLAYWALKARQPRCESCP